MLYELILINEIEQRAKIFFLSVHYYYFFLSATLIITLTTKCKTNLILEKTNKINGLQ